MSKKYLSLDEAARLLSMPTEELVRLRERGEIRGFADRGTWKFKQEDVESLGRKRQADSAPEVPLFIDDGTTPATELPFNLIDLDEHKDSAFDSDSDVRLVGNADLDLGLADSDSDVKLVGLDQTVAGDLGLGTDPELSLLNVDSDSEVKLVRPDSDSDVSLPGKDSDSDVQLVGGTDADFVIPLDAEDTGSDITLAPDLLAQSDSDIKLVGDTSYGDVTLISDDDDAVAIDFTPGASALDEGSGISLGGDSALLLGESGISLEGPSDSGLALDDDDEEGITLALDDDSGISIDTGDSGISLDTAGDSGISLDDTVGTGTVPMMDVMSPKGKGKKDVAETQFEMPSIKDDDDSGYDLQMDNDATGVLDLNSGDDATLSDAVFGVDEDEDSGTFDAEDDLDLEADAFGDDDEQLDFIDADDEAFSASGGPQEFASAGRTAAAVESEWGTGVFVLLTISSILMLACGAVMLDLVKNTATAAQPNPVSGALLDSLGGLYK